MSNRSISETEKTVLELGLPFCPSQKNLNKEQLTLDFYHFIRRLKLKEYFHLNSLSDPNFYEELPTDPYPKYRTDLDEKIYDLLSSNIINEFEASKLQCGSRTPYFYGLPKIHKKFDRFPPVRPICSGFNSCTSKLSEFVDAFLKPLAQQSPSYIKDTSNFVQKIETDVAPLVTHSKTFLVTMDVSSLYPNIDHQEGIDAVKMPETHVLRSQFLHQSYVI